MKIKTVCKKNYCTGCMACKEVCPKDAVTIVDELQDYNAVIDIDKCIDCHACYNICAQNNDVESKEPIKWYQGWSNDNDIRGVGSSGGVASSLAVQIIKSGGIVCSCLFRDGQFIFDVCDNIHDLNKYAGSKYVKSNPSGIYRKIRAVLKENKKVLFIGLPCQVAAVKRFFGENDFLITVDLICHGTPSPNVLKKFLCQYNIKLEDLEDIRFRKKTIFQIYNAKYGYRNYKTITKSAVIDKYLIAFLNCLCYTENCYMCKYAKKQRISDITIGDSWGSELPMSEQQKGLSLILCQTEKGIRLIENSNLKLCYVDLDKAIKSNQQLNAPSKKPEKRQYFFDGLERNIKFNHLVRMSYPKQSCKQDLKNILKTIKVLKSDGGGIEYTTSIALNSATKLNDQYLP